MNRREILQSGVALLSAGAGSARAVEVGEARRRRVIIVGAGILGVSVAYHLAALGAEVVVIDKERGPGLGCTQGAFAMLIADRAEGPVALSSLYGLAVLDWRRLESELTGGIDIQWGGMLHWAPPGAQSGALLENGRAVRAFGGMAQELDSLAFAALAPGVVAGPMGCALFRPNYGALDPTQACDVLARASASRGVRFMYACTVLGLRYDTALGVTAVETNQGVIAGDAYVIAAGAGSEALAGAVGQRAPITLVSGTLAHSRPHRRVLSRVLNGPEGSIKQDPDGRFVTGLDYRPGANGTDTSTEYGERLLASAAEVLPAMRGARLEKMTLGYVPIPGDMRPIVGFSPRAANLYVLVTMSGITMAPLLGRLAASEIAGGPPVELLSDYRPARFT